MVTTSNRAAQDSASISGRTTPSRGRRLTAAAAAALSLAAAAWWAGLPSAARAQQPPGPYRPDPTRSDPTRPDPTRAPGSIRLDPNRPFPPGGVTAPGLTPPGLARPGLTPPGLGPSGLAPPGMLGTQLPPVSDGYQGGRNPSLPSPASDPTLPGGPPGPGLPPGAVGQGGAPADVELGDARKALAEELISSAFDDLQRNEPTTALWAKAAAEVETAIRLNPDEPRYPRMLAEVWGELGDADRAIAALGTYRATLKRAGRPEDPVAQARVLELYLARMQTNGERVEYLRDIVGKQGVPPEVRSHAATLAVPLLLERSRGEAAGMVQQAVTLNPLNPDARRWEWELVASGGAPLQRLQSLLHQVRCNPRHIDALALVGVELSRAGLAGESIEWFGRAIGLADRTRTRVDPDLLVRFAGQLYLSGALEQTDRWLSVTLQLEPDNVDTMLMRLALHREVGGRGSLDQEIAATKRVMTERLTAVAQRAAGAAAPAPAAGGAAAAAVAPAPAGDPVAAAIDRAKAGNVPAELTAALVSAASDLAWLELYFERRPAEAQRWADVIKAVAGDQAVPARRIEGWVRLAGNDLAGARAALEPLQDVDPLAGAGMVFVLRGEAGAGAAPVPATNPAGAATQPTTAPAGGAAGGAPARAAGAALDPAKADQAKALARRLAGRYTEGAVGMLVRAAIKEPNLKPDLPPVAALLRGELAKFPMDWLRFADEPDAAGGPGRFYLLVAQPLKDSSTRFGEPMLARVTLQNISNFDIPIGPNGAIRPDLWFDARIALAQNRDFPKAAYDKVANAIVLRAKETITQVVRIDQGPLGEAMRQNPAASLNLICTVQSNPVPVLSQTQQGEVSEKVGAGPGGIRRQFVKPFIRLGTQVQNPAHKKELFELIDRGLAGEKMRIAQVMAEFVLASRARPDDEQMVLIGQEMQAQLDRLRTAAGIPQVQAWATLQTARITPGPQREALVAPLASSPEADVRMIALLAVDLLPPDARKRVAAALAQDADPQVQLAARAHAALADNPPTPRPTAEEAAAAGAAAQQQQPAATQPADGSPAPGGAAPGTAPADGR